MNETLFCTREFAEAWCRHCGPRLRPFALSVEGSRSCCDVYAVAAPNRVGLLTVEFAPAGFYASPGWDTNLEERTVEAMLLKLRHPRVLSYIWNVRFDHGILADLLERRGLASQRMKTQVLMLRADYEESFRSFNDTIRNQIRQARKKGVSVRFSEREQDLSAYYAIHEQLVKSKGGFNFIFPKPFLLSLIQNSGKGRLLVATVNDTIVGGGVFLCDGNSIFYLHSSHDRKYSSFHLTCAVIDEAIRWAHEVGATSFNFGGSAGIESLERFKASWGTQYVENWRFTWQNPLWEKVRRAWRFLRGN